MNRTNLLLTFVFLIQFSFGQNSISISGKVIDEQFREFIAVTIVIDDKVVGQTDFDGKFKIDIDKNTEKIVFQFIGMKDLTVWLKKDCNNIEIIFPNDGTCFLGSSAQKVNRIRKRNFEKRKKLYKTAYEKGLFSSETLCGKIIFEPYK